MRRVGVQHLLDHPYHPVGNLVADAAGLIETNRFGVREYNIPAVLGLGIATKRIKHGQMIRVDGDNGVVALLDE